jgi:hypothetical protein
LPSSGNRSASAMINGATNPCVRARQSELRRL